MSTDKEEVRAGIGEIADLLISRLGERAVSYAAHQALVARDEGKPKQMEAWHHIAGAARERLRSDVE